MRNIWPIVVGVVVLAGAGVAVYDAVSDGHRSGEPKVETAQAPAAAAEADAVPTPKATFSKVEITPDDYVLGKADAPVTVVEYASLTCPHCARFNTQVLPTIKKDYIDKGLVRLVYRDYPLDNSALMASVVARCGGRDRYFAFIDALFADQLKWARESDPTTALSRMALLGGVSQSDFNACLKNQTIVDAVVQERLDGEKKFGVNSTPTFLINGAEYTGELTIEQFRAIVAPKLK